MQKRIFRLILPTFILFAIFISGCGVFRPVGRALRPVGVFYDNFTSYYNTFYNVKKKFNEAERVRRKNIREHQTPNTDPAIPINTYQAVIESGASLLEYYPNCRWIDDTLLLMGISYARLGEYGRAERKFSELITIFTESEHLSSAYVWRARVIADQGRPDEAEKGLFAALPHVEEKQAKAQAYLVLAELYAAKENWNDAGTYYEKAVANDINNKDERNNAYFALGNALLNQKQYEPAQDAFYTVINRSRNTRQVFNASILWSRCAINLGDYESAEQLLLKLKRNPEFDNLRSAIDVEIAALAVATGQTDRGIELYQEFINLNEAGEEKGIAYFRLGEIYRDSKIDLVTAKAKFDSVAASGASRSLIDSSKTASEGLSRGLISLARIQALKDSISDYIYEADSLRHVDWSEVIDEPAIDSTQVFSDSLNSIAVDTSSLAMIPFDSDSTISPQPSDSTIQDSLLVHEHADSVAKRKSLSPAALLADSLLQAMKAKREEASEDSVVADSMLVEMVPEEPDTISARERAALERIQFLDSSVVEMRTSLMSTYLHSAEFFDETLNEPDSSLKYLELAAEEPCQHENFWKAALQLANRLSVEEPVDYERVDELYRKALMVETIPLTVANSVREKLGHEHVSEDVPIQEARLTEAEVAYLTGYVDPDSVITLYREVIALDSVSTYGLQAWFAIEYIYENELDDFEKAQQITQKIIELFPDSSFVSRLNAKLQEPPDNSIFAMTDEDIDQLRLKAHQGLAAQPDSTGWPPAEETLKGRRYR